MLIVDEKFLAHLHDTPQRELFPSDSGNSDVRHVDHGENVPGRPWMAEKLNTFLTKLKAQTKHEAPVSSS